MKDPQRPRATEENSYRSPCSESPASSRTSRADDFIRPSGLATLKKEPKEPKEDEDVDKVKDDRKCNQWLAASSYADKAHKE